MLHSRMPGQCGAHIFFQNWPQAHSLENIASSFAEVSFDGACVLFSGNDTAPGPGLFAEWLRKQGELVKASKWIPNPRHGSKIRFYRWEPSAGFRAKVQKLIQTPQAAGMAYVGQVGPNQY